MQMKWFDFSLFMILSVLMLSFPLYTVIKYEFLEKDAVIMHFKVRTFDSLFRKDNSLALIPEPSRVTIPGKESTLPNGQYAILTKGPDGLAGVFDITSFRPSKKYPFVRISYFGCSRNSFGKMEHRFRLPFQSFRIDSLTAPARKKLEEAFSDRSNPLILSVKIFPDGAFLNRELIYKGKSLK